MAEQPTQPEMLADLHESQIEHFIIEHDQAHVKQVQTLLAQQGGAL